MAGIAFASLLIYLINYMMDQAGQIDMFANPSVDLSVVSIALLILVISGLLAGLIPAQKAIKLKPVDALRAE